MVWELLGYRMDGHLWQHQRDSHQFGGLLEPHPQLWRHRHGPESNAGVVFLFIPAELVAFHKAMATYRS